MYAWYFIFIIILISLQLLQHVIVALRVDDALKKDAILLNPEETHAQTNLQNKDYRLSAKSDSNSNSRGIIYHRGFIVQLTAGNDIYSANYSVFVYDCGYFV